MLVSPRTLVRQHGPLLENSPSRTGVAHGLGQVFSFHRLKKRLLNICQRTTHPQFKQEEAETIEVKATCKASEGEVWVDEQWWLAARESGSLDRPVLNEMVAEMETCCQLQHWLLRPGHVPLFIASSPLVFTHRLCYLSGISNVAVSVLFKLCFFSFFSLTFEQ